jgi:hypothetical protein
MAGHPLSEQDHDTMDAFIDAALQDFKDGVISRDQARIAIGQVMNALALGDVAGANHWLAEGRKFIHRADQL